MKLIVIKSVITWSVQQRSEKVEMVFFRNSTFVVMGKIISLTLSLNFSSIKYAANREYIKFFNLSLKPSAKRPIQTKNN